jgi:hypothetical protein
MEREARHGVGRERAGLEDVGVLAEPGRQRFGPSLVRSRLACARDTLPFLIVLPFLILFPLLIPFQSGCFVEASSIVRRSIVQGS